MPVPSMLDRSWSAILRVAILAVALAGGLAVAPTSASDVRPEAPAQVTGAADALGSLIARLDHLPVVVDSLPATVDREAIAAYRRATVRDPGPLVEMFDASFNGLQVSEADLPAIGAFRTLLVEDPEAVGGASGVEPLRAVLHALEADPSNADRLNNAAIALWLFAVTTATDDSEPYYWHLQQAAGTVLYATNGAFPGRRPILLNLAFLSTVMPGWDFAGAQFAQEALALDPADITARALLASIQSRRADAVDGADQAVVTLQPLLADPSTAALGHALLGDAHLAAASVRRAEAPASSRRQAALAIAAYDLALGASDDPGLHAGRAKALERLDQLTEAAAEQALVVDLDQDSLDQLVELGRLRHRAGDVDGLREAASAAVLEVMDGWDPPIASARFVTTPLDDALPDDRGFLGWSVGSGIDHLPVSYRTDLGSGVGVVVVAVIPREPPGIDQELASRLAPRSAWQLAFTAAVLDGDADKASSLEAAWNRLVPWRGGWDFQVEAAQLAAGLSPESPETRPIGLSFAETAMRRAGLFGRAADLCRRYGDVKCTGENEYHAGDPAAAFRDLRAAYEAALADDDSDGPGPELRMLVAAAAEAAGDLATAESFLAMTAGADDSGSWRSLAALRAGDLRLDAGDPSGAIAWYDLALATIAANDLAVSTDYHQDLSRALGFRGIRQVAHNNRAVALLRSLQSSPDGTPGCDPGFALDRCEAALADVQAASASDPESAVYRMNEGWALRLLSRADAARAALQDAVRLDPALYPAFNDLGIILALDGDIAGARTAFDAAIAAEPAYDLARWNLGILALRDVPGGIVEGQQHLAAAIRLHPELRTEPLEFRPDNRTYRFGFEAALPPTAGAALGQTYSVGAVVLAATASIAALGQLGSALFGHGVQTAIGGAQRGLDRLSRQRRWRARQRALRRRLPSGVRGLLSWLGVASLLVLVTGWQAAQASPTIVGSAILLAILATIIALVAHEVGHLLAARAMRGRLIPAAWGPGAVVSLLFLPVHAATGPFFAERIRQTTGGRAGAWRFHVAGPLANAIVGVVAYLAFLVEPVPAFRLIAQVQLAAIAYTLLPIRPLDGWALQKEQPRLLLAIGFGVIAAGSAFALGLI